ncbi:hypothetical protein CDO52_18325 [Nocardiopsis gilva YIM 90087]|uniref:Uncharacterized protein n=1 Tax=Nocardiopsis gilva YIM 90087 TaxID=1235441 RepID=A0A223S8T3_9ACTN|nr:hypothetical protein CDO52_18325 [Nocardiopsis gilva YIM 90087]
MPPSAARALVTRCLPAGATWVRSASFLALSPLCLTKCWITAPPTVLMTLMAAAPPMVPQTPRYEAADAAPSVAMPPPTTWDMFRSIRFFSSTSLNPPPSGAP